MSCEAQLELANRASFEVVSFMPWGVAAGREWSVAVCPCLVECLGYLVHFCCAILLWGAARPVPAAAHYHTFDHAFPPFWVGSVGSIEVSLSHSSRLQSVLFQSSCTCQELAVKWGSMGHHLVQWLQGYIYAMYGISVRCVFCFLSCGTATASAGSSPC